MISQRDAFFNKLFEMAKTHRNIMLVSADMGAPSLDQWRLKLPNQYINCGIAEQNAIGIATGLAKLGKKVFCYAIEPFISLRCLEQIKLGPVAHNLPITIVGIGAGFSYEDSGPTHHSIEDVGIMAALPGMTVATISDITMAKTYAVASYYMSLPNYIRLDRRVRTPIYEGNYFDDGMAVIFNRGNKVVFTCGDMVHEFLDMNVTLIDVYEQPIKPYIFKSIYDEYCRGKDIYVVDEHVARGGLVESISAMAALTNCQLSFNTLLCINLSLSDGYCYEYGGRENIRKKYGLDKENLKKTIGG